VGLPLGSHGGSAMASASGGSQNPGAGATAPGTGGSAGAGMPGGGNAFGGSAALGGAGGRANEQDGGPEPDPSMGIGFAEDVWPIFMSECGPCHTTQAREDVNVGSANLDRAFNDAVRLGNQLLSRVNGGGMPFGCEGDPGDPGCLTVAQVETIRAWIAAGRPRTRP
jgi:hypothetical protein